MGTEGKQPGRVAEGRGDRAPTMALVGRRADLAEDGECRGKTMARPRWRLRSPLPLAENRENHFSEKTEHAL